MIDIIKDSIIDCIKLIPFLFLTYLIMEYLEHKTTNKAKKTITNADKFGPIIGGVLGIVPQCGFSVSATNLYVGRVISIGTLISIYLSTSDEMLPIFLSESVPIIKIIEILGIKMLIGILAGIIIDFILRKNKIIENNKIAKICEEEHCNCNHGIIISTLKHTVNISIFILIFNLILNIILSIIGEETLSNILLNQKVFGPVISGMIGLIPNCAASVTIAQLYVKQVINFGTMLSGLLVGSGVGLLILFRMNKNWKENLKIVFLLYTIGVFVGIIFELLGIYI